MLEMTSDLSKRIWFVGHATFLASLGAVALLAQNQPPIVWMGGGDAGAINTVIAPGDGTLWSASSGDHTIKHWNKSNLNLLKTLAVDYTGSKPAAISKDGSRCAAVGSAGLSVFLTSDSSVVHSYPAGSVGISAPILSGNGQTVIFEKADTGSNTVIAAFPSLGTQTTLASAATALNVWGLSADGVTAAVIDSPAGATLNLYNTSTGTSAGSLTGNSGVKLVVFSPDGSLLAAAGPGMVRIWRLSDQTLLQTIPVLNQDSSPTAIAAVTFSADNQFLASADSASTRLWNVSSGTLATSLAQGSVSVDFTPNGAELVVAGADKKIHMFSLPGGAESSLTSGHTDAVTYVAYSPDMSMVASASKDGTIELRRANDGTVLATMAGHTGAVSSVAFSPNGTRVVSGGADGKVILWDTATFSQISVLAGPTSGIGAVTFSPDGFYVAAGTVSPLFAVWVWDSSGAVAQTLTGLSGDVSSIAFAPDGETLAAGTTAGVGRIWAIYSGTMLSSIVMGGAGSMNLSYSPNGQSIAIGFNTDIFLVSSSQGLISQQVAGAHSKPGTVVAFGPDGQWLVSGNPDGTLKIWDTGTWTAVNTYNQETFDSGSGVTAVAVSNDNTKMFYGRGDATTVLAGTGRMLLGPRYMVASSPDGLTVVVDGSSVTTPTTYTTWTPGGTHTLSASSQGPNSFLGWSDGGAATHTITLPAYSTMYKAKFLNCSYQINPTSGTFAAAGGSGLVTVTTNTGCPWTAVSSNNWIHVTAGASGTGNGTVSYTVDANLGATRTTAPADFRIAGQSFSITQSALASNPAPTVTSLSPVASSGSSQSYILQFSDTAGWQNIGVVNALINNYLDGRHACYVAYSQPANTVYLVNDAGDAGGPFAGSLALNGSGTVSNSQCTIHGSGSSRSGSGTTMTLTLNMSFSSGFGGNKVVYLAARDVNENNSGWQTMGVRGIPPLPSTYPQPATMTPASNSTSSQVVTFKYNDASSATNLQTAWALINTAIDGRVACYVAYYRPGNQIYLFPDNGDGTQATSMVLSGSNSLSNSQCTVSAQGSSVTTSGNQMTLNLKLTLNSSFAGPKATWLAVTTMNNSQTSQWQALGAWHVPTN